MLRVRKPLGLVERLRGIAQMGIELAIFNVYPMGTAKLVDDMYYSYTHILANTKLLRMRESVGMHASLNCNKESQQHRMIRSFSIC